MQYIKTPSGIAALYSTFSAFPPNASNGSLAVASDNQILYAYETASNSWVALTSGPGGTVTAVTASAPLASSGGSTPNISITQSGAATDGYLSSTDWNTFNSKQIAGNYITSLTGDATASGPGSAALTLATVNSNVGSFGTATQVASVTVNAKGLVTAASNLSIQIAESQVTNLVSDLAGKQAIGNYITALTGDVTATGPGSSVSTIANLAVTNAKIANATIDLTAKVTGILPIANGGTNSSAALNNNRVMQSSGGAIVEAAAITASRALQSDSNGIPIASSVTSTELGYVSGVTSSIQTQLNSLVPQAPTVNKWVYVSQYGSDVTGDGTYNKPYASTAAAYTTIGAGASTTNRYGIHIQGTVTEVNIYLKPYCWFYGSTWGASRLNASSGNITLDPTAYTTGNSRSGMTNVYLTGSTGISLDFVSVSATGSHVVEMQDVGTNGAVVITPNNSNQYLQWRGGLLFSNLTIHGSGGLFTDLFIAGNLTVDNGTVPVANPGANFVATFIGGNLAVTSSGATQNLVQLNGSLVNGTSTITNSGAVLYSDISSLGLKSSVTTASGGSVVRTSDAYFATYTPTTAANWLTVPTEAAGALDILAVSGIAKSQSANLVLASPNGSSGLPTFRSLVATDIPSLPYASSTLTSAHIYVGNGSNVATDTAVSGDITISNAGVTVIGANKVANSQLAQMAAHTYKGNNTGSTANAIDVTSTQLTADLNLFTPSLQGLVPASGGGTSNFLRADGTFAAPSGTGVSVIGTINSQSKSANGAVISGTSLVLQEADATNNGLISTGTQTLAGNKTFSGSISASNLSGTNTGDQTITLTGDVTGSGTGSFAATIASNAVSNSKFRQSAAQSVVGNSTNATADVADISASAADQILRANGSGTAIAFGSIDLSKSGAVGSSILSVPNGGTGDASFTAYSVICGGTTSTGVLQNVSGIGSSGQVLTSNGAGALPTWQASGGGGSNLAVTTKTTTYSITTADALILLDSSGGAFTVTLPTAVGNTGKQFYLKKTTNDFNVVTVATTSSQTIDGVTTRTLVTQYEQYYIVSDGSNWVIQDHKTTTDWISGAGLTYTGLGTVSAESTWYKRSGSEVLIRGFVNVGTTTATTMFITIPAQFTLDSAKYGSTTNSQKLGDGFKLTNGSTNFGTGDDVLALFYDSSSTVSAFICDSVSSNAYSKKNGSAVFSSGQGFNFEFKVSVSGWTA